ncbi:MAG: diguanylate cyclase [Spirochaetaceae bacterium]|nr:diguanylate cyclase [Spirochaetaceae bacterium]
MPFIENNEQYRILVIDDEKANRMVLSAMLSPDYTVLIAKSGPEGLKRVAMEKPDIILLDIVMPEMDGFEVLKRLKESGETKNIPVIIITCLNNEADEEKGLVLGAVDYIGKPFKDTIVKARVKNHIQIIHQIRAIERLGLIDGLTNIPNRRCFDERLYIEWRRSLREQRPITFMMLDMDNFKAYNDTYGHPQGDLLLRTAAAIFATAIQRSTDFAARLGGEEFGVLLPDTDQYGALRIAEKIRMAVETANVLTTEGSATEATVSIGVASLIPSQDMTLEAFVALADNNLYMAKKKGRNQVCS